MLTLLDLLQDKTFPNKIILEKIICRVFGRERKKIILEYEKEISDESYQKISQSYNEYVIEKKPLEYIIGYVHFLGNDFKVNQHTLIPRPETEYMITSVNDYVKNNLLKQEKNLLIDVGTGCGVLGLSVLLHNKGYFDHGVLTDITDEALAVAQENYFFYKDNIEGFIDFRKTNLLDFLIDKKSFSLVVDTLTLVSNLPYIPEDTFENNVDERVKKREPTFAFVGGEDGCDLYRKMFDQLTEIDQKKPLKEIKFTMFLEMMSRQADILRKEYADVLNLEDIETFHFNIKILKGTWK